MDAAAVLLTVAGRFRILYETGQAVDFEIVCNDRSWKVHRFVMCLYSDLLACACDGNFRETAAKRVDLSADGEDCVDALVRFMYYFDYTLPDTDDPYTSHVNVAILADKYDMPNFVKLANRKLVALLAKIPLKFTADLFDAATLSEQATGPTTDFRAALTKATISIIKTDMTTYTLLIQGLPKLAQSICSCSGS
ncbi:hypothetical protein LTR95_011311 [Oleoguttula sp. CCFEE 5521]